MIDSEKETRSTIYTNAEIRQLGAHQDTLSVIILPGCRFSGDNVDAAIRASGKTAEEIARVLKVDKNTISRHRTGRKTTGSLPAVSTTARAMAPRRRRIVPDGPLHRPEQR
jgi:hypothetical protein